MLHPVLHLNLSDVGVGALGEGRGDLHLTLRTFRGAEIQQAVDPGELLLDYLSNRAFHGFCRSTRI